MKFAVTLTLNPKLFRKNAEDQFDLTNQVVISTLKKYGVQSTVAELTSNMNVHYHSIINVDTPLSLLKLTKSLKDSLRTHPLLGFVVVKLLENEPGWISYMSKDLKTNKELLNRYPVITDDLKIFDEFLRFTLYDQ